MKKRVWSILLALCMVLCLVPTAAWAAGDADITGTGSTQDPYLIYTAQGLKTFRDKVNNDSQRDANAKLMADIVLNDGSFDENGNYTKGAGGKDAEPWSPIGNIYRSYCGTFDGGGYTIKGLYVNGSIDPAGLFGKVERGAAISNLIVTGFVAAEPDGCSGGIVGKQWGGSITGCINACTVQGDYCGGIVGEQWGGSITGCINTSTVQGDHSGGIVGEQWSGSITNCYNIGTISGGQCGGIAFEQHPDDERHSASITNCYSIGRFTDYGFGILSYQCEGNTSVNNCYYLAGTAVYAVGGRRGTQNNVDDKTKTQFADGTVLNLLKQNDTTDAWGECGYLAAAGMTLPLLSWQTADEHTHDYQWKYNDTEHWEECSCSFIKPDSKAAHSAEENGICTNGIYCACGYEMYPATMDHNWSDWEHNLTTHARACQNPGCSATQTNHCTGGTATCQQQAICTVCNQPYGSYDSNNHTGTLQWNRTNNTHEQVWSCCGAIVVQENHHWADGVCTDCGWSCSHSAPGMSVYDENHDHKCDLCGQEVSQHTGGIATCIAAAKCEVCGESYGDVDMHNHADLQYFPAKAATQAEAGNWEYWYCSGCGKYYTNNDLTEEITRDDTVIPKLPEENKPGETKPATTKPVTTKPAETKTTTKKTTEKTTAAKSPRTGAGATQGALLLTSMAGAGVLLLGCKKRRLHE